MRSVVALLDSFTSHSTWLKPFALVFHSHPIHGHAQRSLSVFFPSLSTSCSTFSSSSFLMTDGDSVTMNTLCNSENGTFVTLDDYLPITFNDISWGSKDNKKRMRVKCLTRLSLRKEIWSRTTVIPRTWIREKFGTLIVKIVHKENGTKLQRK